MGSKHSDPDQEYLYFVPVLALSVEGGRKRFLLRG